MSWLITKFYEEEGREKNMGDTRTLAVQMPAELFDRLSAYLARHGLKKKTFLIDLITRALEDAEDGENTQDTESTEDTEDAEEE